MKSILKTDPFLWLLLAVPVVIAGEYLHWNPTLIFFASVLAIIPLAKLMGDATEELSAHTGPKIGGLLNASLGNAAELIITLVAINAGLLDLVKASITGSIISNILLVTGGALLVGGFRNGLQKFDRTTAGLSATQLTLAVIALAIPAIFYHTVPVESAAVEELSIGVAAVMITTYLLNLIFGMRYQSPRATKEDGAAHWSLRKALAVLALDTLFIVWLSEIMVGAVEPTVASLGVSEFFVGIIVIPIVGNAAENFVAITVAAKDEMDLSLEIALGSSIQIALFVAPLLVFISLFIGPHPLNLIFHPFELAALASSVIIAVFISQDGESNWMEGVQLISVFLIIALAFFFLPH
jgi:Ca2+:H+ antiporter